MTGQPFRVFAHTAFLRCGSRKGIQRSHLCVRLRVPLFPPPPPSLCVCALCVPVFSLLAFLRFLCCPPLFPACILEISHAPMRTGTCKHTGSGFFKSPFGSGAEG